MNHRELAEVVKAIDAALAVYGKYERPLTAAELSVKKMLLAIRRPAAEQLQQAIVGDAAMGWPDNS